MKERAEGLLLNSENIKQAIGIQLIFILETKLQKELFLAKYDSFYSCCFLYFEPVLRWEFGHVYNDLRTEKEGTYSK